MNESARRPAAQPASNEAQFRKELGQRAAMYYRLRFSKERALARLRANALWDFEQSGGRPRWLSDATLEEIVTSTYNRRPS